MNSGPILSIGSTGPDVRRLQIIFVMTKVLNVTGIDSQFGSKTQDAVKSDAPEGASVLCMLPDTGERYLSTPLFADVPVDMTSEELEISASTPNFRLVQKA